MFRRENRSENTCKYVCEGGANLEAALRGAPVRVAFLVRRLW